MKIFCCVVFYSAFLLALSPVRAQYVQFTENKGQWDNKVMFAGDAGVAGFFLQKNGYRVLLNDTNDINTILKHVTGHHTGQQEASTSAKETDASIAFSKGKPPIPPGLVLHSHAYDVTFVGASANPQVLPEKSLPSYNNYFIGNDSTKWASHCQIFQALLYKNMYPGIDVRYYTNNGQLKYDIIVNPGADISKLALQFTGADGLSLKKGSLVIKTSVGDATELAPVAYQATATGRENVDVKFYVAGNTVYFKTGNFSKTAALVIDPAIVFCSLTGSLADNWGYTATYDAAGNFYAGGIAFAQGYPTTTGAFQQSFSGGGGESGFDAAIIKLSAKGSAKIFATYLGGGGNEQPHSMVVDNAGYLIVAGRTNSSNFPTTLHQFGSGGGWDIFITKFAPDGGSLAGSLEIGGAAQDGVNEADKEDEQGVSSTPIRRNYGDDARSEVIVDASNNIYLASCTSSANELSTPGAFQTQMGGGEQDGLLVKTDPNLNILFSSYLGGKGIDAAFVLALNPINNDIYVGGATTSNNLAGTGGNAGPILNATYQQGACDGFVSIISNDGSTLKKTVYVGGAGDDMVYGIQFDKLGYPYIMGTTTLAFPVINAAFSAQSKGKQFITKLQPGLTGVEYSTNFGKGSATPDISPVAFLVDRCENVYVSGWGGGINSGQGYPNANTNGLSVTPNAIQAQTNGNNFYFFVLKKNGDSQLYGTFYGELETRNSSGNILGDHVDGGTSRFDKQGVIYQAVCANCGKSGFGRGFPTTSGVYARTNLSKTGAFCNEAAIKIAFQLAGVTAGIRPSINGVPYDTSGCAALTVDFTDTMALAKQYSWNFEDGSPIFFTTSRSATHTFKTAGNYRVQVVAIDSTACNMFDTLYINIRVRNDKADVGFSAKKIPPCTSLTYQFINTSQPPAGKPFSDTAFIWNFGDGTTLKSSQDTVSHTYPSTGTYTAGLQLVDTNYCNAPYTAPVQLRISSAVKASFTVPPGCSPYVANFDNTSQGGQQFTWDFGDGSTSTDAYPQHLYADTGDYTITLKAVDSSTCNITDSYMQSSTIHPKPKASFSSAPLVPQADTPINFSNGSSGGTHYLWDFGDGDTLVTIEKDTTVSHIYNTSNTFKVYLVAYNQFGCTDTARSVVQAIVVPLVDIPNAFTPNGDNVNDRIQVRGYGIEKMDWRIYNRWGVLVFGADNQEEAWDGYYNGRLQPQDVYTYVLNVVFSDGTKYQKKGDITLLR